MWYLLIPPNKGQRFDASAPQSKWTVFSAYRTPEDCKTGQAGWAAAKVEEHYNDAAAELRAGRCVRLPLDDPRLHSDPNWFENSNGVGVQIADLDGLNYIGRKLRCDRDALVVRRGLASIVTATFQLASDLAENGVP